MIGSVGGLGTVTGLRDRLTRLQASAGTYAAQTNTTFQAQINDAIEDGYDRLSTAMGDPKTWQQEGKIEVVADTTGSDGVVTANDEAVTSVTGFGSGVAARDRIQIGDFTAAVPIASVTSPNSIELVGKYPGSSATAQSFVVYRDEYAAPAAAWALLDLVDYVEGRSIPIVDEQDWTRRTGDRVMSGRIEFAMVTSPLTAEKADANTVGLRVRFWPLPVRAGLVKVVYWPVATFPTTNLITAPHLNTMLYLLCASALMLDMGETERHQVFENQIKRVLPQFIQRDLARGQARIRLEDQFNTRDDYGILPPPIVFRDVP